MVSIVVPVSYFFDYIVAFFLVGIETGAQEVLEEEDPQDGEHDEEFDEDDDPQLFPYGHAAEAVVVKVEDPVENVPFQICNFFNTSNGKNK
jgi:hypothetical protein